MVTRLQKQFPYYFQKVRGTIVTNKSYFICDSHADWDDSVDRAWEAII